MIKSFFEFILESSKSNIKIFFSSKLSNFLFDISRSSNDSDVVEFTEFILSQESKEENIAFSYIDLTDKNDMLSFVQKNRIYDLYVKDTGSPKEELFDRENKHYFDWQGFEARDKNSSIWSENRTEARVGKVVRKLSGSKFPDKVIERFVNEFKSFFDFKFGLNGRFEIVSGEEIRFYYLDKNYVSSVGQLGNSCMRYAQCQKYLDIYVENPKVCKLLILRDDPNSDKISGRALIWTTSDRDSVIYMDRAYTSKDADSNLMYKYAEEKGWESNFSYNRTVQLEKCDFDHYPYMDTFCVLNKNTGELLSDQDDWMEDGNCLLRQTDGSVQDSSDLVYSNYHGEYIERDGAVFIESHGRSRRLDDWIRTDDAMYLQHYGEYFHPDEEVIMSEYDNIEYLVDDVHYSNSLNIYILKDKCILIPYLYDQNSSSVNKPKIHIEEDYIPKSLENDLVDVIIFDPPYHSKTLINLTLVNTDSGFRYLNGYVAVGTNGLTFKDGGGSETDIGDSYIPTETYIKSRTYPKWGKEELIKKISDIKLDLSSFKEEIVFIDRSLGKNRQWDIGLSDKLNEVGDGETSLMIIDYLTYFGDGVKSKVSAEIRRRGIYFLQINKLIKFFDTIRDKVLEDNGIIQDWYYYVYFKQK